MLVSCVGVGAYEEIAIYRDGNCGTLVLLALKFGQVATKSRAWVGEEPEILTGHAMAVIFGLLKQSKFRASRLVFVFSWIVLIQICSGPAAKHLQTAFFCEIYAQTPMSQHVTKGKLAFYIHAKHHIMPWHVQPSSRSTTYLCCKSVSSLVREASVRLVLLNSRRCGVLFAEPKVSGASRTKMSRSVGRQLQIIPTFISMMDQYAVVHWSHVGLSDLAK